MYHIQLTSKPQSIVVANLAVCYIIKQLSDLICWLDILCWRVERVWWSQCIFLKGCMEVTQDKQFTLGKSKRQEHIWHSGYMKIWTDVSHLPVYITLSSYGKRKRLYISVLDWTYHFKCRRNMVHGKVWHVRGKALIQPNLVPPFHRHQISKPLLTTRKCLDSWNISQMKWLVFVFQSHTNLVSQLMCYENGDHLLLQQRGPFFIIEQTSLLVCDQPPVFHTCNR